MVLSAALFGGFFLWGVVMVWIDARAKRQLRQKSRDVARATVEEPRESTQIAEEAERWLQHH
jgi:uncharacterized membrane protein